MSSHARGGQILCTRAIAIDGNADGRIACRPCGVATFKNVLQPVEVFVIDDRSVQHLDPVCRMAVALRDGTPAVEHAGRTIYFCSAACAHKFQADPAAYAGC